MSTILSFKDIEYKHDVRRGKYCIKFFFLILKDTQMEKAPSNKTPALTKSSNMGIFVVGISNQLFLRGS